MNQHKSSLPQTPRMHRRGIFALAGRTATGALAVTTGQAHEGPHAEVSPLKTEFTFEALVRIEPAVEIGPSSRGVRRYIPITGGSLQGPKIRGSVLPGGADWQLQRPDGVLEIDALYSIKADDGAVIIVRYRGLVVSGGAYFRTMPTFEAPRGPHEWLNQAIFVGSVGGAGHPDAVLVRVFRVL